MNGLISYLPESEVAVARLILSDNWGGVGGWGRPAAVLDNARVSFSDYFCKLIKISVNRGSPSGKFPCLQHVPV